jgi:dienelactone hydrolase
MKPSIVALCVVFAFGGLSAQTSAWVVSRPTMTVYSPPVGLVRFHAAELHIDPHKIGVLGFSAGGHLVAAISTHFEQRL